MTRIDLFTGQGAVDVIVDLRPATKQGGRLVIYDGSVAFHDRFGGRTYYQSRSGLSHGGWVPADAGVARVATYRVDCARPRLPELADVPVVYGRRLIVPVSYTDRQVDHTWPVLDVTNIKAARWSDLPPTEVASLVRYLHADEVLDVLLQQVDWSQREYSYTHWHPSLFREECIPDAGDTALPVHLTESAGYTRVRVMVRHLLHDLLRWRPVDGHETATPHHWVGLRRCCRWAYPVRGGVAGQPVDVDELGIAWRLTCPDGQVTYLATDGGSVTYLAAEVIARLTEVLPVGLIAVTPELVVGRGRAWSPVEDWNLDPVTELRLVRREPKAVAELAREAIRRMLRQITELDRWMEHRPEAGPSAAGQERTELLRWLVRIAPTAGIPVWGGHDPHTPDYPDLVYLDLPGVGQVSWHVPAGAVPGLPAGPEWDGHSREEKSRRIDAFTKEA